MVVGELNIVRLPIAPDEANPPLIVDPDAVLPASVPTQRLEPIARHDAQLLEAMRRIDDLKLPPRPRDDPSIDAPDQQALEQRCRTLVSEAPDHMVM
jgi:hypothetical protein